MIESVRPPHEALHAKYGETGAYIDCFTTVTPGRVSHPEFVEAFYTSRVFKLERLILRWTVDKPSTDAQARELAEGGRARFAAWKVEDRSADQLLMCDYLGHMRSWLMVTAAERDGRPATRLHFGSVVTARHFPFNVLLAIHRFYSRILLRSAIARLANQRRKN